MIKHWIVIGLVAWLSVIGGTIVQAAEGEEQEQMLFHRPVQLTGPLSTTTFYYTIHSDDLKQEPYIHFDISHSPLLIEPSSLSVAIDGVTVKSIGLTGKEHVKKWTVPLSKEAMKEGVHEVTVTFNGLLKEGVCIDQELASNWATLHITSHVSMIEDANYDEGLVSTYRTDLKGTSKQPSYVLVPNEASDELYTVAYRVGATLAGDILDSVKVVEEKDLPTDAKSVVVIGMSDALDHERLERTIDGSESMKEGDVWIGRSKRTDRRILYYVATDEEALVEKSRILTDDLILRQLTDVSFVIDELPEPAEYERRTLRELQIAPMFISSFHNETETHILPIRRPLAEHSYVTFHFQFERSTLLMEGALEEERPVELLLYVNDIPYAVDLKHAEKEDQFYTTSVAVPTEVLEGEMNIAFRLVGNGFVPRDPCITQDEMLWLQIDDRSSFIQLPPPSGKSNAERLDQLPAPYAFESSYLVFSSMKDIQDETLFRLNQLFHAHRHGDVLKLRTESSLTEEEKEEGHLIVVNGEEDIWYEGRVQRKEDGLLDLAPHGFVSSGAPLVAWTDDNPWNADRQLLVIRSNRERSAEEWDQFLTSLVQLKEPSTVAMQSLDYTMTNSAYEKEVIATEKQSERDIIVMIGLSFVGLLVLTIIGIVWTIRKRRREAVRLFEKE